MTIYIQLTYSSLHHLGGLWAAGIAEEHPKSDCDLDLVAHRPNAAHSPQDVGYWWSHVVESQERVLAHKNCYSYGQENEIQLGRP